MVVSKSTQDTLKIKLDDTRNLEFMVHPFAAETAIHSNISNALALHCMRYGCKPKAIAVNAAHFDKACKFLYLSQIAVLQYDDVAGCDVWTVIE